MAEELDSIVRELLKDLKRQQTNGNLVLRKGIDAAVFGVEQATRADKYHT